MRARLTLSALTVFSGVQLLANCDQFSIAYAGGSLSYHTGVSENTGSLVVIDRPAEGTDIATGQTANGLALPKDEWGVQRMELESGPTPHCALYVNDKLQASIDIPSGRTVLGVGVTLGADTPKFSGEAGTAVMRYDNLVVDVEK